MTNLKTSARLLARIAGAVGLSAAVLQAMPAGAAPTANGRIVYGIGTTTPQNRAYTAGSPGTFAGATAAVAGAIPTFVVERAAPTWNEHIAGYVTAGGVLYVMRWNGTSWSNVEGVAGGPQPTITPGITKFSHPVGQALGANSGGVRSDGAGRASSSTRTARRRRPGTAFRPTISSSARAGT